MNRTNTDKLYCVAESYYYDKMKMHILHQSVNLQTNCGVKVVDTYFSKWVLLDKDFNEDGGKLYLNDKCKRCFK